MNIYVQFLACLPSESVIPRYTDASAITQQCVVLISLVISLVHSSREIWCLLTWVGRSGMLRRQVPVMSCRPGGCEPIQERCNSSHFMLWHINQFFTLAFILICSIISLSTNAQKRAPLLTWLMGVWFMWADCRVRVATVNIFWSLLMDIRTDVLIKGLHGPQTAPPPRALVTRALVSLRWTLRSSQCWLYHSWFFFHLFLHTYTYIMYQNRRKYIHKNGFWYI